MSTHDEYTPSPAAGAKIAKKEGPTWTLLLVRDLKHPPARVWKALTDPEQLREWAPFDSDQNLATTGVTARLTTVGAPQPYVADTQVKRAEENKLLEFAWGGGDTRWELEALPGGGTRLTLWAGINKNYIAMGAAGWHVCFDVLDRLLAGQPVGRWAGMEVMKNPGWQRLHAEYQQLLAVETPHH